MEFGNNPQEKDLACLHICLQVYFHVSEVVYSSYLTYLTWLIVYG